MTLPSGRALLAIAPELFIDLLKAGGVPRRIAIVEHGLPPDTTVARVRFDGRDILLELASATFPEPGDHLERLPAPRCQVVEDDQRLVHDACRLRAALLNELRTWTGAFPSDLADLLAETRQYQILPLTIKGAGHA